MRGDWDGLSLDGTIYRGSLFSDRNTKTGPDRAGSHVGRLNLDRGIFFCLKTGVVFF